MPSPSAFRLILLALLAVAPACGGGSAARPGPLKHKIDDMYIARIPMDQKNGVLEAKNSYDMARMEQASVEAEYSESGTDLQVAKNELAQTKLDEKSAQSRKKAADESADMTRVEAGARDLRVAQLQRQAAAKKVEYMKARREFLKKKLLQAEDESYAREARFELTKARLAKANNIRPKGFDPANYERQAEERSKFAQRSKSLIQRDASKAESLRREWQALLKESDRAQGKTTGSSTGVSPNTLGTPSSSKPKAEEPKAEEPKAEEPKADEPKADEGGEQTEASPN
jgi:hypothetical protein